MKTFKRLILAGLAISPCVTMSAASADSTTIRRSITDRIDNERGLGAYNLSIDARGETVVLEGSVPSAAVANRIEDIARTTEGVRIVDNRLQVTGSSADRGSWRSTGEQDPAAEQILRDIRREMPNSKFDIHVTGNSQQVVLDGRVEQRADAERIRAIASRSVTDRRVISNLLVGTDPVPNGVLRERILTALNRNPEVNLNGVEFTVTDGHVHFTGDKPNHRDIDRILSVVLMVDGVREVTSSVHTFH